MSDFSTVKLECQTWAGQLCGVLADMWQKAHLCDVKLMGVDDDQAILAHSTILAAASPLLHEIFQQGKMYSVRVDSISHRTWTYVLQFVYCGTINVGKDELPLLYKAADQLQIALLKDICGQFLELVSAVTEHDSIHDTVIDEISETTATLLPETASTVLPEVSDIHLNNRPGLDPPVTHDVKGDISIHNDMGPTDDITASIDVAGVDDVDVSSVGDAVASAELPGDGDVLNAVTSNDTTAIDERVQLPVVPDVDVTSGEDLTVQDDVSQQNEVNEVFTKVEPSVDIPVSSIRTLPLNLLPASVQLPIVTMDTSSLVDVPTTSVEELTRSVNFDRVRYPVISAQPKTQQPRSGGTEKSYECQDCGRRFAYRVKLKHHMKYHVGPGGSPFKCGICGKTFAYRCILLQHERTHSSDKPCTCNLCGKSFKKSSSLKYHIMYKHTDERPYKCDLCGAGFILKARLREHELVHSEDQVECDLCFKILKTPKRLLDHKKKVHAWELSNTPKTFYACSICGQQYKYPYHLKEHIARHVPDGQSLNCQICNKEFTDTFMWQKHQMLHDKYDNHDWPHPCPHCPRKFEVSKHLKRHLKSHDQKLSCGLCARKFLTQYALWIHQQRKHYDRADEWSIKDPVPEPGSAKFQCDDCYRKFNTTEALHNHIERAHPTDPDRCFICSICGKRFGAKSSLYGHERTVHKDQCHRWTNYGGRMTSGLQGDDNSCDICGEDFSYPRLLQKHQQEHHPEQIKSLACKFCDMTFMRKSERKQHYRSDHEKEAMKENLLPPPPKHKCPMCPKVYHFPSQLKQHQLSHSGTAGTAYTCPLCQKGFQWPSLFKGHLKGHGKKASHLDIDQLVEEMTLTIVKRETVSEEEDTNSDEFQDDGGMQPDAVKPVTNASSRGKKRGRGRPRKTEVTLESAVTDHETEHQSGKLWGMDIQWGKDTNEIKLFDAKVVLDKHIVEDSGGDNVEPYLPDLSDTDNSLGDTETLHFDSSIGFKEKQTRIGRKAVTDTDEAHNFKPEVAEEVTESAEVEIRMRRSTRTQGKSVSYKDMVEGKSPQKLFPMSSLSRKPNKMARMNDS